MSTNLGRIGEKARKEPELVFTSLYHHVTDVDNLRACYDELPKDRVVGTDGVTITPSRITRKHVAAMSFTRPVSNSNGSTARVSVRHTHGRASTTL